MALAAEARGGSRVGITVSKAVGDAVVRNRLRRRVKSILDRIAFGEPPHRDVVLIARPGAGEATFAAVAAEIGRLFAVTGLLVFLIRAYKRIVSPLLPPACRFVPTCSEYAVGAIEKHGPVRGVLLAVRRIVRCASWQPGGFDPVP